MCHNSFLGYSQIHFITLLKKKRNGVVFERHCSPPSSTCAEARKKKDFENLFLSSPFLFPNTSHISYPAQPSYPVPRHGQGSHLTLCHGRGKVPLSSCTYKYRGGKHKKKGEGFLKINEQKKQTG
jgi:hypothetical protein